MKEYEALKAAREMAAPSTAEDIARVAKVREDNVMLEIPKGACEKAADALFAAYAAFKILNHPLADKCNEALSELEDAMEESEATEP